MFFFLTDEPANPGSVDNSLVTSATFTILRSVASLSEAVLYWEVVTPTNDITPINGTVVFGEGVNSESFQISSQADNVSLTHIIMSNVCM